MVSLSKMVSALCLSGSLLFASSAFAGEQTDKNPPPGTTKCSMDFKYKALAVGAMAGGGKAHVTCTDSLGHKTEGCFKVRLLGAGAMLGWCKAQGNAVAAGVGLNLNNFVELVGSAELGLVAGKYSKTGTLDLKASSGLHLDAQSSVINYTGPCIGLGAVKAMVLYPKKSKASK